MKAIHAVGLGLFTLSFGEFAQAQAPAPQTEHGKAVVVMSDEGGLDPVTSAALVQITTRRLVEAGLQVVQSPELKGPQALDEDFGHKVRAADANRVFVIHILRLYYKVIEQVDERDLDGKGILATASLPGSIEESDAILPRLVDAVLTRQPVAQTAQYSNIVSAEAGGVKKRNGEHNFLLGLPLGLSNGGNSGAFGFSIGYLYETEHFGVGIDGLLAGGSNAEIGLVEIHGQYYFLPGDWSPYAGAGAGYMGVANSNSSGEGAGLTAEIGVEFMRTHHMHVQVGLQGLLPIYTDSDGTYLPAALLNARLSF